MKLLTALGTVIVLVGVVKMISCKKEYSCENCREAEIAPVAIAGKDTTVILPLDSIKLDGSASSDIDGVIQEWLWTKIAGPVSFEITHSKSAITSIKNIIAGSYQFELRVIDNDGLSAKDTISVTVNAAKNPPVANAGTDHNITLPLNNIVLDGTGSTDPDNNISGYSWSKIAGPASYNVSNNNASQTTVGDLIEGVYKFELTVIDADGLFSRDTVLVTVLPEPGVACDHSDRPLVNVSLIPVGKLSKPKWGATVATAGNKIVFAGGRSRPGCNGNWCEDWGSARVDIYDIVANTWSTAELSVPRYGIASVAAGDKLFFAGGESGDGAFNSIWDAVDVYDITTNSWSVLSMSEPRSYVAAGVSGKKLLFAGGYKNFQYQTTDKVDIYDMATGNWSTKILNEARANISAVSIKDGGMDVIYFGGGVKDFFLNQASRSIDIYNPALNTFGYVSLQQPMGYISGIGVNESIYWAAACHVEMINVAQWSSSSAVLSHPGGWTTNDGQNAVVKDDKIVFFTGAGNDNKFDIYDITTNTWSIGVLPANVTNIGGASIVAVNNTIYIAGGYVNGVLSDQVWQLEF